MKRSHPEKNFGETSKKRKTYTCEECTQPFTRKDKLETHIQNNHLPFNCKFCSLSFIKTNTFLKTLVCNVFNFSDVTILFFSNS